MSNFILLAVLVCSVLAVAQDCGIDPHGYCISQGVNNCPPEDRLIGSSRDTCRVDVRYSPGHVLPEEWELLFDSFDYENNLVGSVAQSIFLSREFDNDGDVRVSLS